MSASAVVPGVLLDSRYRLGEVIGAGGMATVHRARDEVLARDVAVKLFPATGAPEDLERQQAEIAVLARLNHPGLVRLLDAGVAGDRGAGRLAHLERSFLVMELVPGPTLAEVLDGGPLPPATVAAVGAQLAGALAAVHEAGIVHRDVKPANILLAEAGWGHGAATVPTVKVADFGIARLVDAARLTVTGMTLGTASYLSPEQAVGGAVGPATDVYALGLVLLECLTGRKAFAGTVAEVAAARVTTDPVVPAELGSTWVALLTEMTRRDADARPTMAAAAGRLAELVAREEPTMELTARLPAIPVAEAEAPALRPRRAAGRGPLGLDRRGTRVLAAGLVLAAGAVGGVALWPSPPTPTADGGDVRVARRSDRAAPASAPAVAPEPAAGERQGGDEPRGRAGGPGGGKPDTGPGRDGPGGGPRGDDGPRERPGNGRGRGAEG